MSPHGLPGSNPRARHQIQEALQRMERGRAAAERIRRNHWRRTKKQNRPQKSESVDFVQVRAVLTGLLHKLAESKGQLTVQERAQARLALNEMYKNLLGAPLLQPKEVKPLVREALGGVITMNELEQQLILWQNVHWAHFRSYLNSPHALGILEPFKPSKPKKK